MYSSGELASIDSVIRKQERDNKLIFYSMELADGTPYYKFQSVLARKPEVLVMGSSRVLQFREQFFDKTSKFYNAGGPFGTVRHFRIFLESIPQELLPELVVVGLDHHYFNSWDSFAIARII